MIVLRDHNHSNVRTMLVSLGRGLLDYRAKEIYASLIRQDKLKRSSSHRGKCQLEHSPVKCESLMVKVFLGAMQDLKQTLVTVIGLE